MHQNLELGNGQNVRNCDITQVVGIGVALGCVDVSTIPDGLVCDGESLLNYI